MHSHSRVMHVHVCSKGHSVSVREQERHKWRLRETEAIEREGIYLEC